MGTRGVIAGWPRAGAAVTLVVSIAAALGSIAAGAQARVTGFAPVGSLTYAWHGDPAGGCAAEGLCGVTGSVTLHVGNTASGGSGVPVIALDDSSAVARSVTTSSTGAVSACADPVSVDLELIVRRGSDGGLHARPQTLGAGSPPSAGACAGPTAADVAGLVLPARKLARGGYDLSGTDSFGAGPFQITVTSRVRALAASFSGGRGSVGVPPPPPPRPRSRRVLVESAAISYRVVAIAGSLSAGFSGLADPFCEPFGTCGSQGGVTLSLLPHANVLGFSGARIVKRQVGSGAALNDLRGGRLALFDTSYGLVYPQVLTGKLDQPGLAACQDTVRAPAPSFESHTTRHSDRIVFVSGFGGGFGGPFSISDPLRSRCAGPSAADIVGAGALASGAVAVSQLGADSITITLRASGAFSSSGYAGTRDGSLVLTLARRSERGGTRRETIFFGQAPS